MALLGARGSRWGSYPVCYPVALRLGRTVNNHAKGDVNNRRGSGLAVSRTLKCERTVFWVGLQIAPRRAGGVRCVPFSVLSACFRHAPPRRVRFVGSFSLDYG